MRLEGATCFRVAQTSVKLDGRTTLGFNIACHAIFTGSHVGRILFLSRGDGIGTAHASTLVFDLAATIDIGAPMATFHTQSKLYVPQLMTVVVNNPFDQPATFRVVVAEQKPLLDLPKLAGDGGEAGGSGKVNSLKQGISATTGAMRAAKLAGLSVAAMTGAQSIGDDPMKKLPSSFWSGSASIAVEPHGTYNLPVQFLPFQLGAYQATVLFADEAVGEFSYELRAVSSLPSPIETLAFQSESASSAVKDVVLPFRNPLLEKARQTVLERSTREKERMSQIWGKDPLLRGPVPIQISYGSPNFCGPAAIDLVDNDRRAGRAGSQPRTAGGSTIGSIAGSGAVTPRDKMAPPTTAGGDANKMQLRFVPSSPGHYTSELLLLSPLDVRLYELAGACSAPGMKAALECTTPARMPLRQELPVVNCSEQVLTGRARTRFVPQTGPRA